MSQARTSSVVGARPTPNVGDCADTAAPATNTIVAETTLRQAIAHAPIAQNPPWQDGVVVAGDAEARVERLVPELRGFGARRLHGAQFVGTARHEHALLAVPLPVHAEPRVRDAKDGRLHLRLVPRLPAVSGD